MNFAALGLGLALLAPPEAEAATRAPPMEAAEASEGPAAPAPKVPAQHPSEASTSASANMAPAEPSPELVAKRQRRAKAMLGIGGSLLGLGGLTLAIGLPLAFSDGYGGEAPIIIIPAAVGLIAGSIFLADGVKRRRQASDPVEPPDPTQAEKPAAKPGKDWQRRRKTGQVLVGVGLGGLGLAAVAAGTTASACAGGCYGPAFLGFVISPVVGAVSLGLVIPGGVLWSSANKRLRTPPVSVAPMLSPTTAGLSLSGRF